MNSLIQMSEQDTAKERAWKINDMLKIFENRLNSIDSLYQDLQNNIDGLNDLSLDDILKTYPAIGKIPSGNQYLLLNGSRPMTGNLNMGGNGIENTGYIQFDLAVATAVQEGRAQWNPDDGTLEIGMPGGNVVNQVGQEITQRVTNDEGALIANGKMVYVSGGVGANALVKIADNTDFSDVACKTLAMATEDIAIGQKGYVHQKVPDAFSCILQ